MDDGLNELFSALSDPTRRAILGRLAYGKATVAELAKPFKLSQPAISKHLKVLEEAGLIRSGREANSRPRELEPDAFKKISDWIADYRRFWDQNFDRLDDYLSTVQGNENDKSGD
ncbi:ArsR/SmtB family transcription factor [Rhizobium tubonense]|uniref:Transcriptional regulator n=1 Tax=Rhizobium tubonense TaxID=484088 RepID=A0A2W4CCH2_9HYPH|nr:metalloregulator ArsR/SmtB family transcription factor [Rhizobium tubonense]PZM08938.1 transcriptional regulator [Rhizobium tubonense]